MLLSRGRCLAVGLAATMLVSGCIGLQTFRTHYDAPISAEVSRGWRVVDVNVSVPRSLVVSEAQTYEPKADIVWREEAAGDRYAQVEKILHDAITQGASGARGGQRVRLDVVVSRFHAMTFQAESLQMSNVGVHNINFTIRVVDASSGAVLAGPDAIDAAFPAKTGARMAAARARGESQKSQITAHVRNVVAGWLGLGPDARITFTRAGI